MPAYTTSAKTETNTADDRGRIVLPLLLAVLFLGIAFAQAWNKLLWGDEFVTYWIGQQHSLRGIWTALASGADPNPPLMHLLNWASTALFGSSSIAVRLPSIAGVGLALTSLWMLLRKFVAPIYAAAGCLALMTTRGFDYTYDARSYGLLLGFAIAALLCWLNTNEQQGTRRWAWLAAMTLALACGLSSNYYGVLAFFPIAAGEIVLLAKSRKLKLGTWVAMLIASLPLLAYLHLIRANIAEFGPHAWNKPQLGMIGEAYVVLVEGIICPVLLLGLLVLWRKSRGKSVRSCPLTLKVRVAFWVLMAYPVLGFAIAYGGAGMISARCTIPVCAGVAIAGALLLSRLASQRIALWAVMFLVLWVTAREAACGYILRHQRQAFLHLRNAIERADAPGERVLVGDSLVLMPLYWYGSPALRQEIVFPIDFDAIHRLEPDDSGEENIWGGRNGVFPVPIAKPAELIPTAQESLFVGSPSGWLAQTLQQSGFTLREIDAPRSTDSYIRWDDLGGVFTPMAHPQTGMYFATPAQSTEAGTALSSKP